MRRLFKSPGCFLVIETIDQRNSLIEIFLSFAALGLDRMVLPSDSGQVEIRGFSGPRVLVLREKRLVKRKTQQ